MKYLVLRSYGRVYVRKLYSPVVAEALKHEVFRFLSVHDTYAEAWIQTVKYLTDMIDVETAILGCEMDTPPYDIPWMLSQIAIVEDLLAALDYWLAHKTEP